MKQIYILIAGMSLTGTLSAQLVNGNFEAPFTNPDPNLGQIGLTAGWLPGVYKAESSDVGQGAQSAKLTSVNNSAVNAYFGGIYANDNVPGFISTVIKGTMVNAIDIVVDYKYKYTPVGNDKAVFLVKIYDTLQAGAGDDQLMYSCVYTNNGVSSTWSSTLTMTVDPEPGASTATANMMKIIFSASMRGFHNDAQTPLAISPGSTLLVDDIVIRNLSFLGIKETSLVTAKIYPNPTSDVLNFKLENTEAAVFNIYGTDGKQLLSTNVNGLSGSVDISSLNAGMYFYEITTVNGATAKSTFVKN